MILGSPEARPPEGLRHLESEAGAFPLGAAESRKFYSNANIISFGYRAIS